MAFQSYGASQSEGSKKEIDYDELNAYVVEAAGLQERETVVGIVSVIADLGTQEQPDAEVVFTGSEADEAKEIEKNPNTYFEDGFDYQSKKNVRFKKWPQKPVQCVAIAVDFPDIIVDKGKFFGESKPLPLRVWMGGQFYIQSEGMVVQRPTPLKVNKKLKDTWSLDQKSVLYQMAVAHKVIKPGDVFPPSRIDEILGAALQFQVQIYMKDGKDGKQYFTEYIKFASSLGRGMSAPESDVKPALLQFNAVNEDEDIQSLRNHIVNTMRRASNFEGSKIAEQIERLKGSKKSEGSDTPSEPKSEKKDTKPAKVLKEKKPKVTAPDPFDDMDDDIPFN